MKNFTFVFVAAMILFGTLVQAQKVTDIIINSPDHELMEAALIEVNLVDDLQGSGPFTVFAPTDAAFSALPVGLLETLLNGPRGPLTDFLLYHIVPGNVKSTDLQNGQVATIYNGKNIQITISEAGVFINNAKVSVVDIEAENGVVHVIDAIVLPENTSFSVVDIALGNDAFTSLVAALTRDDLTIDFCRRIER